MLAMGELRRRETLAAVESVGLPDECSFLFLGYPDFGTLHVWNDHWDNSAVYESRMTRVQAVPYSTAYRPGAPYNGEAILQDLESILKDFRPTKIFIPQLSDQQPDHQAAFLFAQVALWDVASSTAPDTYYYLVHYPEWPPQRGLHKDLAAGSLRCLSDVHPLADLSAHIRPNQ